MPVLAVSANGGGGERLSHLEQVGRNRKSLVSALER